MKEVLIRKANISDLENILILYQELFPNDHPIESSKAAKTLNEILENKTMTLLLLEHQNEIVSSCVLITVPNLTRGCRPFSIIENVITKSSHRKKGLASHLLKYAMQLAKDNGAYKISIQTGSNKEETLRFYENLGLVKGSKIAFIWKDEVSRASY